LVDDKIKLGGSVDHKLLVKKVMIDLFDWVGVHGSGFPEGVRKKYGRERGLFELEVVYRRLN
jgi:hypothetical protein